MALAVGNSLIGGAYVGANQVRRAYKGSSLVYQGWGPVLDREFVQMTAPGGPAELSKIYGKTIINNQQIVDADRSGTASHTGSNTYMIISLSTNQYDFYQHKVFIRGFFKLSATPTGAFVQVDNTTFVLPSFVVDTDTPFSFIGLINTNTWHEFRFFFSGLTPSAGEVLTWHDIELIDLTLRFGAGNEPTSVAQFEADYPEYDPTYDPGSLQSNKTSLLRAERVPVINVWDEEWELGGINNATGAAETSSTSIRSKHYIPVTPGTIIYFKAPADTCVLCAYRDDFSHYGTYSGPDTWVTSGGAQWVAGNSITIPAGVSYLRFKGGTPYGTTYNHDICINLSDPAINGTYYPHWRGKLTLNIPTLTSGGVAVFPYGMCRVGDIRDEAEGSTAVQRIGAVDLGTLTWYAFSGVSNAFYAYIADKAFGLSNFLQSKYTLTTDTVATMPDKTIKGNTSGVPIYVKDSAYSTAADFKAAMSGVYLYYELATPVTYLLDTPLPTDLTCEQDDILKRVSGNNCPFVGEMRFGL